MKYCVWLAKRRMVNLCLERDERLRVTQLSLIPSHMASGDQADQIKTSLDMKRILIIFPIFLLLSYLLIVPDIQPYAQWWVTGDQADHKKTILDMKRILILFISNCEFRKITFAHNVTMFSVHFALIWKVWTNPFFVSHNPSMCPYNQFCWQLLYAGLLLWNLFNFLNWQLCTYRTHKCFVDTWHQANEIFHSVHKT